MAVFSARAFLKKLFIAARPIRNDVLVDCLAIPSCGANRSARLFLIHPRD
jgi:hypothetical protein